MIKRDILSWWFRPPFLQPWGKKAPTLFAGPWLGEFGWEVMNWQPFLRWLAPQYEKVIISCRMGSEALYQDFCQEFIIHKIKGTPECNWAHNIIEDENWSWMKVQIPRNTNHLLTVGWQPNSRKKFIPFGKPLQNFESPLLLHPRGRDFGTDRNWNQQNWNNLIAKLNQAGITPGIIGLSSATCQVEGNFEDYRDIPLNESLDIIASGKLLVGPSSGPMHLASLCKTPHLVWTDHQKYARGLRNRDKYLKLWNPFQTKAIVLDEHGFSPPQDLVYSNIMKFLTREMGTSGEKNKDLDLKENLEEK